ncbi:MAG: SMC-Scp complex subunit ScpB, partial [Candidatus Marinimicrobia bacterium]|nr:SMC-Scp complex subunit ScpB [Candidatus Neomarinimicrobiota bacterium]
MVEKELINIIEALLFASPEPLTQSKINLIFEDDPQILSEIVEQLQKRYHENDHGIVIAEVAGGYQLVTR